MIPTDKLESSGAAGTAVGATQPAADVPSPAAAGGPAVSPVRVVRRPRHETLYFAVRDKKLVGGAIVVAFFVLAAIIGPMFTTYKPMEYVAPGPLSPRPEHWFGTTMFGQDVYSQFANGLRTTFIVGLLGGLLAAAIGMTIGFVGGYAGGWTDEFLNIVTNVVLVIPTLAVLLVVAAYFENRDVLIEAVLVGVTSWPWAARAIRAQTFSIRSRDFVDLARLSGMPTWKILFREIAPNMASYLFLTFILLFGGAILIAATLDFIGLGPTDSISLGRMMNIAVTQSALLLGQWWWFVPPGAAITAIVGALYVMNAGLDEVFNPKLREM